MSKRTNKDTRVELVAELEKITPINNGHKLALEALIKEAKAGQFHDYKSKKYAAFEKVQLVTYLLALGLEALATQVKNGDYDEMADEEDLAEMRRNTPKELWDVLKLHPGQSKLH